MHLMALISLLLHDQAMNFLNTPHKCSKLNVVKKGDIGCILMNYLVEKKKN